MGVLQAIRQAGGRIFDRRTMDLVVAKDKAFAVCPPSMLREESALLSKNCPDFRLGEKFLLFMPHVIP